MEYGGARDSLDIVFTSDLDLSYTVNKKRCTIKKFRNLIYTLSINREGRVFVYGQRFRGTQQPGKPPGLLPNAVALALAFVIGSHPGWGSGVFHL
jgi:hypothetical protein